VDQDEPSRTLDSLCAVECRFASRCSLIKTPSEGYWGTPCFLTARICDATWLVGQHSDVPSTRATSLIMSRMRVPDAFQAIAAAAGACESSRRRRCQWRVLVYVCTKFSNTLHFLVISHENIINIYAIPSYQGIFVPRKPLLQRLI
jgi:hypothetical protein